MDNFQNFIRQAYVAFNSYDIPTLLTMLHPQVRWMRVQGGDYATGPDEVRSFWQRQWQKVDTHDEPTSICERADGRIEVAVHQLTTDKQGKVVFNGPVNTSTPSRIA